MFSLVDVPVNWDIMTILFRILLQRHVRYVLVLFHTILNVINQYETLVADTEKWMNECSAKMKASDSARKEYCEEYMEQEYRHSVYSSFIESIKPKKKMLKKLLDPYMREWKYRIFKPEIPLMTKCQAKDILDLDQRVVRKMQELRSNATTCFLNLIYLAKILKQSHGYVKNACIIKIEKLRIESEYRINKSHLGLVTAGEQITSGLHLSPMNTENDVILCEKDVKQVIFSIPHSKYEGFIVDLNEVQTDIETFLHKALWSLKILEINTSTSNGKIIKVGVELPPINLRSIFKALVK